MRPNGSPRVIAWIDARERATLFICAPVLAELRFGIERMPSGRRRAAFDAACRAIEFEKFHGRILPFDERAAHAYGALRARRVSAGDRIGHFDAMVAAIAAARGMAIATRNLRGFAGLGLDLVDPFATA